MNGQPETLLLIDVQHDFLPGGALSVPQADEILPVIERAIASANHVVATQDWHPPDHGSFASQQAGIAIGDMFELHGLPQVAWPDHCVQHTRGAEFAPVVDLGRVCHVVLKGTEREIDSYSGFFDNGHRRSTGLHDYLKSVGTTRLRVLGLATDYCVKFTVLDGLKLGYDIVVDLAGCRGVDLHPGDVDQAIREMKSAGATIMNA